MRVKIYTLCSCLLTLPLTTIAAATHRESSPLFVSQQQQQQPFAKEHGASEISDKHGALQDVLDALQVMQETYFDMFAGTWSDAIDWTAAVMGTHISSTLSSIVEGLDLSFTTSCSDVLHWENTINQYFTHISWFYFSENAFALRGQAYDDMLWVVLGWLENIKFTDMYKRRQNYNEAFDAVQWHGTQLSPMAAHRARIFYELASYGWDDALCDGGMVWNSRLSPYKNAITNELYAAASISMYLYFPGDNNSAPFLATQDSPPLSKGHDPKYLENAIKSYKWLKESHMRDQQGLYQDGFHVSGWRRYANGTVNPGTGRCDEINSMVYTYNQGVLLTANRGLWLATGARSYLDDGHDLIRSVISATGWPSSDRMWRGLGRAGILEEFCDHGLYCSQDGQTFKGVFFHHLTEFCRPLRPSEKEIVAEHAMTSFDSRAYQTHLENCAAYSKWIHHNARAAMQTKNEDGLFGMWWGVPWKSYCDADCQQLSQSLAQDALDHLNPMSYVDADYGKKDLNDRGRGRTVETQSGALAVLKAKWLWQALYT